jgi:hypothetical protein
MHELDSMQNQKYDHFLLLIAVVCYVFPVVSAVEPVAALGSRLVVELLFVVGSSDAVNLVAVVVLNILTASLQASIFSFYASFASWVIVLLLCLSQRLPPNLLAPRLPRLTLSASSASVHHGFVTWFRIGRIF